MKANTMLTLDRSEVESFLPYALICETRERELFGTGKVKRRFKEEFTDEEREMANKIFAQSHRWYLKVGVPESVTISTQEFALWIKLGDFCLSLEY